MKEIERERKRERKRERGRDRKYVLDTEKEIRCNRIKKEKRIAYKRMVVEP